MAPTIFKTIESSEFLIPERCHIIEIMNQPGIDFSIARARVEPGVTTALHAVRGTTESYYILQGTGTVQLGDTMKGNVGAGDVVMFPRDAPQTITNTGKEDLIFLAICYPRFVKEAYTHLES
jgi:mannose-6-phosphate isomerase-like protein (cupin superfamily)